VVLPGLLFRREFLLSMPAISLVVCVYKELDLLERLLRHVNGYYDDLVVVHDGPDESSIGPVVTAAGGRFFEHPRCGSLEGQSPFAWAQARYDWILRLDADEFPSDEMKEWLRHFRGAADPEITISGYTCIWPLWNGKKAVSKKLCTGRVFLFDRRRVRFFGMVEQGVVPDGRFEPVDMILHHQPRRKSYGLHNVLVRKQAYRWRAIIARSLLGKPTDLPCWRWESEAWPERWEEVRRHPLQTGFKRLVMETLYNLRRQWRAEKKLFFDDALNGPVHHAMIGLKFWQVRRQQLRQLQSAKKSINN
jgi:glycosyltransferase involved in cell wall biosynthesis